MSIRFPNIGINIDYLPRSVTVFGFEITIYGILIAAGMLLGLAFVILQAKRHNEDQNLYLEMSILGLVGGTLGARLCYVAFSWELFRGKPLSAVWNFRSGGMSIYGGILGGVLFAWIFCKIRRLSFGRMADTASMGLLIGQIIGVWGNFFNRESFGAYTDTYFAMQLPLTAADSAAVTNEMRSHLTEAGGISYIQVHPLFLYESIWCLFLFLVLLFYTRRKKYQGEIFYRYLAGYGLGRCVTEYLRTDKLYIPGTKIPVFLILSAFLFVWFGIMATGRRIMAKKREKIRRQRREERYAEEEKHAHDLDNIGTYENVQDEFAELLGQIPVSGPEKKKAHPAAENTAAAFSDSADPLSSEQTEPENKNT